MGKAKLPPELCGRCGKTIKGNAIANLWKEQVVCTPCYEWHANQMATEAQLSYATALGFEVNPEMLKGEVSRLISIGTCDIFRLNKTDRSIAEAIEQLKAEGRAQDVREVMLWLVGHRHEIPSCLVATRKKA